MLKHATKSYTRPLAIIYEQSMKIYIRLLLILTITQGYSQCEVTITDFIEFSSLNENQLETEAIRGGFIYDHSRKAYFCEKSEKKDGRDMIVREIDSKGNNITLYSFYNVKNYLDFKTTLEKDGEFLFTENEKNAVVKGYKYKNKFIFLTSRTVVTNNDRWNIYTLMTKL